MLGDKAYDSADLREELDERGTKPVIPNRCNRKQPFSFSKRLYKLRWRATRNRRSRRLAALLQIDGLVVPVVVELGTPYFV